MLFNLIPNGVKKNIYIFPKRDSFWMLKRKSQNMTGALFMSISMAGYVANDAFMKLIGSELGLAQTIFIRGVYCSIFIFILFIFKNEKKLKECFHHFPIITARSSFELFATIFFLIALINMSFANVNSILQTLPLVITIAACIFLKETIGYKRVLAIIFGFLGVLLIIKPGTSNFNNYSILAILAVLSVTFRDILTRKIPKNLPALFLSLVTSIMVTLSTGFYLMFFKIWSPIDIYILCNLGLAAIFLMIGYFFSVEAMRFGDVSFVSPFRYTLIIWAMLIGYFFFKEKIDLLSLIGIFLIIFSGLFVLYRENQIKINA